MNEGSVNTGIGVAFEGNPNYRFIDDGRQVGHLYIKDDVLRFEGDVSKSIEIFLTSVLQNLQTM